MTKQEREA